LLFYFRLKPTARPDAQRYSRSKLGEPALPLIFRHDHYRWHYGWHYGWQRCRIS
jgi:hypothetical protein